MIAAGGAGRQVHPVKHGDALKSDVHCGTVSGASDKNLASGDVIRNRANRPSPTAE
jgi:hypothetical protein